MYLIFVTHYAPIPGKRERHVRHTFEPRHEKLAFCIYAKTKTQISCAVTGYMRSLFYLNPKCQASWLYSPVCVGPVRKPRSPVFSQRGSNFNIGILKPSSNRSPNIFTLFQKVKIGHTKRFNSKDKSRLCRDFAGYFISK